MKPTVLMLSQEVHPIPPLKGAAVEQWIDAVAQRMTGFTPLIVSPPHPDRPDAEEVGGAHYRRIRMGRVYKRLFRKLTRLDPWSYVDRIAAAARAFNPAIVHVHNAPQFVAPLKKRLPEARFILHMHNEKRLPDLPPVEALAGCSDYIREWYRSSGARAARFETVPNGVDVERVRPAWEKVAERAALREKQGLVGKEVILFAGRISPEKGLDLLLKAFANMQRENRHLATVGEWPQGDPAKSDRVAYAETLKPLMEGLPVTHLGVVSPEEMGELYLLGDLLVIPSRFEEPFSMVAIEAMAAGIPVLALKKGGMVEYMRDGENARLLPSDCSPAGMAESMDAMLGDPALLERLSRKGRETVENKFAWERATRVTEMLYSKVLAS